MNGENAIYSEHMQLVSSFQLWMNRLSHSLCEKGMSVGFALVYKCTIERKVSSLNHILGHGNVEQNQ